MTPPRVDAIEGAVCPAHEEIRDRIIGVEHAVQDAARASGAILEELRQLRQACIDLRFAVQEIRYKSAGIAAVSTFVGAAVAGAVVWVKSRV